MLPLVQLIPLALAVETKCIFFFLSKGPVRPGPIWLNIAVFPLSSCAHTLHRDIFFGNVYCTYYYMMSTANARGEVSSARCYAVTEKKHHPPPIPPPKHRWLRRHIIMHTQAAVLTHTAIWGIYDENSDMWLNKAIHVCTHYMCTYNTRCTIRHRYYTYTLLYTYIYYIAFGIRALPGINWNLPSWKTQKNPGSSISMFNDPWTCFTSSTYTNLKGNSPVYIILHVCISFQIQVSF